MLEFLIGLVVGGTVGVVAYYLGHVAATRLFRDFMDSVMRDKSKLEADLAIAEGRIQDLILGK